MIFNIETLLTELIGLLNSYAGLLSLFAVLAAIIVPYRIYHKQRKDELESIKDELESIHEISRFPMASSERELYTRKFLLEKRLKRK